MVYSRRSFAQLFMAATCLTAAPVLAADRYNVVATTGMLADLMRNLGGSLVQVKGLMGTGVDPHSYRHTRSAIVAMIRADLTVRHGLHLEMQMMDFFSKLSRKRSVVAATDTIPKNLLRPYDGQSSRFDPHVWMDPSLWVFVAEDMADVLTKALPDHADDLVHNLGSYRKELIDLDRYAQTCFASIPEQSRVLVTAHDAFGYLGKRYGIEVIGLQGMSTNSEAGVFRISELVDTLVTRNIGAVFVESSVSSRNLRALIEGAAARGHSLALGGELYSDAMGLDGTYTGTYLGMIDHNVTTITRALGGTPPDRGRLGKLEALS